MQSKVIHQEDGRRTFALVFDKGDEFISTMEGFARENNLQGSHFSGIGAFSDLVIQYFQREKMEYKDIPLDEQLEVLTLLGNIAVKNGGLKVHSHGVFGRPDGSTVGGHVKEAHVWPTLEVILTEAPYYLQRKSDPETGLALLDFS